MKGRGLPRPPQTLVASTQGRTFSWQSEVSGAAHVHLIIIGFSLHEAERKTIYEYDHIKGDAKAVQAAQINPYLIDAPSVAVQNRTKPIVRSQKLFEAVTSLMEATYFYLMMRSRFF